MIDQSVGIKGEPETAATSKRSTGYFDVAPSTTPVRATLVADEELPDQYPVSGFVLFNTNTYERNFKFCEAYFNALTDINTHENSKQLIPTYWLLDQHLPLDTNIEAPCEDYTQHYNFSQAQEILAVLDRSTITGPVLVAWPTATPYEQVLIFDLSTFDSNDFVRAINIWKGQITASPECWNDGFNMVKIRETLRNLIQQYGETIVSLIRAG